MKSPITIALDMHVKYTKEYEGRNVTYLNNAAMENIVSNTRRVTNSDWATTIWNHPLVSCIENSRPFVQGHLKTIVNGDLEQVFLSLPLSLSLSIYLSLFICISHKTTKNTHPLSLSLTLSLSLSLSHTHTHTHIHIYVYTQVVLLGDSRIIWELGNHPVHGFFDATFSMVPTEFSQVLIYMCFFSKFDMYVPVYFALMTVSTKNIFSPHT
jgi:hypothetical protein